MPDRIRIVLVEDSRLLRDGLAQLLTATGEIDVLAAIPTTRDVLDVVLEQDPEVVLLDLGLRAQTTIAVIGDLVSRDPSLKIVLMDLLPVQTHTVDFVEAGVSGFVLKDATFEEMLRVLRLVKAGEKHLPEKMTKTLFSDIIVSAIQASSPIDLDSVALTKREKEVTELVATGLSNKEIANELHLATQTVKTHVHNILRKLALESRVQIAAFALNRQHAGATAESGESMSK